MAEGGLGPGREVREGRHAVVVVLQEGALGAVAAAAADLEVRLLAAAVRGVAVGDGVAVGHVLVGGHVGRVAQLEAVAGADEDALHGGQAGGVAAAAAVGAAVAAAADAAGGSVGRAEIKKNVLHRRNTHKTSSELRAILKTLQSTGFTILFILGSTDFFCYPQHINECTLGM